MSVRRLRTSWWIDFRFEHRRYRLKSPDNTRVGAQAYEATVRAALARGDRSVLESRDVATPEARRTPTFAEFAERWFDTYVVANNKPSEQRRKKTLLRSSLVPVFGSLRLTEVGASDVERYKHAQVTAGKKAKTINNHLTVLGRCLRSAVEWDEIRALPRIKLLKNEPVPFRFLDEWQAESLVHHVKDEPWRSMIVTALRTGLRYSELIALEWDDVDLGQAILRVRLGNVAGAVGANKVNRIRYIPLTSDVVVALSGLPRDSVLVFSVGGSWIRHDLARRKLARFCAAAGVPHVGWHALRHTFASQLVNAGATVRETQELLGHSSMAMTMRYVHVTAQGLRRAVDLLASRSTYGQPVGNARPTDPECSVA